MHIFSRQNEDISPVVEIEAVPTVGTFWVAEGAAAVKAARANDLMGAIV